MASPMARRWGTVISVIVLPFVLGFLSVTRISRGLFQPNGVHGLKPPRERAAFVQVGNAVDLEHRCDFAQGDWKRPCLIMGPGVGELVEELDFGLEPLVRLDLAG